MAVEFKYYGSLNEGERMQVISLFDAVREQAANNGLAPELLAWDKSEAVRCAVARTGFDAARLSQDASENVRLAAMEHLEGNELANMASDESVEIRKKVAQSGVMLEMLSKDADPAVRAEVAAAGYAPTVMITDEDPTVRAGVARAGECLDQLASDPDWQVRAEVAKQGYALPELMHDPDWQVRAEVAKQGYGAATLVSDTAYQVRVALANAGLGLSWLVHDKAVAVRVAVAEKGYGLATLVKDKAKEVRVAVAKMGYGIKRLMRDKDAEVREAAMQAQINELTEQVKNLQGMLKDALGVEKGDASEPARVSKPIVVPPTLREDAIEQIAKIAEVEADRISKTIPGSNVEVARGVDEIGLRNIVIRFTDVPGAHDATQAITDSAYNAISMRSGLPLWTEKTEQPLFSVIDAKSLEERIARNEEPTSDDRTAPAAERASTPTGGEEAPRAARDVVAEPKETPDVATDTQEEAAHAAETPANPSGTDAPPMAETPTASQNGQEPPVAIPVAQAVTTAAKENPTHHAGSADKWASTKQRMDRATEKNQTHVTAPQPGKTTPIPGTGKTSRS